MSQTGESVSERSSEHGTFTIERTYAAAPRRVFEAWSELAQKTRWFGPPEKPAGAHTLDFREGGSEHLAIPLEGGPSYSLDAIYHDIVPDQRIVYTYDMRRDEDRISVSVATVEFEPDGERTRLKLTEQGVFLDGIDTSAEREHGTGILLDGLAALFAVGPESA